MIQVAPEIWIETMQGVIDNFLKPKFIELGMNASGQWLSSLEARYNNNRGEIWGMDYTYYLANGRRSGKRPPISPLVSWVGHKFGLQGTQAVSAAFAVANKIAAEGTNYYPDGTDLIDVLSSKEVLNYVYSKLGIAVSASFRKELIANMKKTFQDA